MIQSDSSAVAIVNVTALYTRRNDREADREAGISRAERSDEMRGEELNRAADRGRARRTSPCEPLARSAEVSRSSTHRAGRGCRSRARGPRQSRRSGRRARWWRDGALQYEHDHDESDAPTAIVVRPFDAWSSACWTTRSLSLSRLDVASSALSECSGHEDAPKSRMAGLRMSARAMDRRCRWPPESCAPLPPSCVSRPCGRPWTASQMLTSQRRPLSDHALGIAADLLELGLAHVGAVRRAEEEVLADGAALQRSLLCDEGDVRAVRLEVEIGDVDPVAGDLAEDGPVCPVSRARRGGTDRTARSGR